MNNPYRVVYKRRKPKPDDSSSSEVSFPTEIDVTGTAFRPSKRHVAALHRQTASNKQRFGCHVLTKKRPVKLYKIKRRQ